MKYAIDTFSYYMNFGRHWYEPENPVDIRWYCEKSLELGAKGLHIDPYHMDIENDTDWVKEFADSHGMYIELGACGTSPDDLKLSILAAKRLGAVLLRTFVGGDCLDGREETAIRAAKAKEELAQVLPFAREHGIKIALENHGDLYMEDILHILELNDPNLGICYDSGNFAFTGEDPLKALDLFKGRILCTHLKDVCSKEDYPHAKPFDTVNVPVHYCALGEGYLPMDEIIRELKNQGIKNITLEICSPCDRSMAEHDLLEFEMENVEKSISYLIDRI